MTDHLETALLDATFNLDVAPDADRCISPPNNVRTPADDRLSVWVWRAAFVAAAAILAGVYLALRGHA